MICLWDGLDVWRAHPQGCACNGMQTSFLFLIVQLAERPQGSISIRSRPLSSPPAVCWRLSSRDVGSFWFILYHDAMFVCEDCAL